MTSKSMLASNEVAMKQGGHGREFMQFAAFMSASTVTLPEI
jgi:hypothetical protein